MMNSSALSATGINLSYTRLLTVVMLLSVIICCIAAANTYAGVKGLVIVLIGLVLSGVLCAVLLASVTYIRVCAL